jgi:hypothetical protein
MQSARNTTTESETHPPCVRSNCGRDRPQFPEWRTDLTVISAARAFPARGINDLGPSWPRRL